MKLLVTEDWIEARFKSGTRLFSRTIADVQMQRLEGVMASMDWKEPFVELPKGLDGCLDRALVILDGCQDQHTDLKVRDQKLRLHSKSPAGEARDFTKLPKHDDVSVRCDPALLKRALKHSVAMRIESAQCVAFTGEGKSFRHMVTVVMEDE